MIEIKPIPAFYDNYIWMISHPESKQAIVVDPGLADGVIAALSNLDLTLKAILITHHHNDHTGGIKKLTEIYPVPVYGPKNEHIPACTNPLTEGDIVTFSDMHLQFHILDIPGHTNGHIAYVSDGMVFCGDTLFAAGCGRVFEGTPAQMLHSLQKLASLPPETKVYCAHEYTAANLRFASVIEKDNIDIINRIIDVQKIRDQNKPSLPSTIATELKTNPFLRCDKPQVIKAAEAHSGHQLDNDKNSVFSILRRWKDKF